MKMNGKIAKQFIDQMDENMSICAADTDKGKIMQAAIMYAFQHYGVKKLDEDDLMKCSIMFANAYEIMMQLCDFPISIEDVYLTPLVPTLNDGDNL